MDLVGLRAHITSPNLFPQHDFDEIVGFGRSARSGIAKTIVRRSMGRRPCLSVCWSLVPCLEASTIIIPKLLRFIGRNGAIWKPSALGTGMVFVSGVESPGKPVPKAERFISGISLA